MNKKTLLIVALTITTGILLLIISRKEPHSVQKKTAEDEMPDFKFQLIDGAFIQASDMDGEKYTLLWFFNPGCDICIREVQVLTDSISLLDNCQIVLISYEDFPVVSAFYEQFQLQDFPAIQVAYTSVEYVFNMFKIYAIPTLYVYHPDRRMIKYKPGPVTIQEIVEYLK